MLGSSDHQSYAGISNPFQIGLLALTLSGNLRARTGFVELNRSGFICMFIVFS